MGYKMIFLGEPNAISHDLEQRSQKSKSHRKQDSTKTKKQRSSTIDDHKFERKEAKSKDSLHSFFRRTKKEKKLIKENRGKNPATVGKKTVSNAPSDREKTKQLIASLLEDAPFMEDEDLLLEKDKVASQAQNLFRYKPRDPVMVYAAKKEEPPPPPKKKKKMSKFMMKVTKAYETFQKFRAKVRTDFPLSFFFYLFFAWMSTAYYLSDVDTPNSPFFKQALVDAFVLKNSTTPTDRYIKYNFLEISTNEEMWNYILYTFMNQIQQDDNEDKTVLGENHLVGSPRLRLLEVRDETCSVPIPFKTFFQQCFGHYSSSNELERSDRKGSLEESVGLKFMKAFFSETSTQIFMRNNHNLRTTNYPEKSSVYRLEKDLGFSSYQGYLNIYPGNGFFKVLNQNRESNMQTIRMIQSEKWFQGGGRALIIEVVFYNSNYGMWAVMKLVLERTSAGGILPSYKVQVMDLHRYIRVSALSSRVNILVIWFFLANYLLLHLWGMIKEKIAYILRIWNLIEFAIAGLFVYFFMLRGKEGAASFLLLNRTDETGPWDYNIYNNIDHIVEINKEIQNVTALLYFLIWAKVFQYLTYTYGMSSIAVAIGDVVGTVWAYFTLYFLVVMAFAAYGCLLFGYMVDDFFSFQTSFLSMLRGIAHSFDFESMYVAQPKFAFAYMFLFYIVVMLLLLSALSMALIESYMRIVSLTKKPMHFTFSEWLRLLYENPEDNVCWSSALYGAGFEPEAIPLLQMKYQLEPCDRSDAESLARIIEQEKASFQGQGKNYLIMQHEIASLNVRMRDLELITQLMVWKCTDMMYKLEVYGEGWAEARKDKEAAKLMF